MLNKIEMERNGYIFPSESIVRYIKEKNTDKIFRANFIRLKKEEKKKGIFKKMVVVMSWPNHHAAMNSDEDLQERYPFLRVTFYKDRPIEQAKIEHNLKDMILLRRDSIFTTIREGYLFTSTMLNNFEHSINLIYRTDSKIKYIYLHQSNRKLNILLDLHINSRLYNLKEDIWFLSKVFKFPEEYRHLT